VADSPIEQPDPSIFHIAFERDWTAAMHAGEYRVSTRGATLEDVGFIHAGFENQVSTVGTARYHDVTEPLVVLVIDVNQLDVPVVVENLEGGAEAFPHIYGPLPVSAVVAVRAAGIDSAGQFIVGDSRGAPNADPRP
jgi:uncharacterized protein (DUF952 family)